MSFHNVRITIQIIVGVFTYVGTSKNLIQEIGFCKISMRWPSNGVLSFNATYGLAMGNS